MKTKNDPPMRFHSMEAAVRAVKGIGYKPCDKRHDPDNRGDCFKKPDNPLHIVLYRDGNAIRIGNLEGN